VIVWRVVAILALVLAASALQSSPAESQPTSPKLLVMIVVDQMRFDYIERYGKAWTAGLHRLVTDGAVFERAAYPYLNTVTCAGHATIGTGAFPYKHGIILNEWYRRDLGHRMACTDDGAVSSVPYSLPAEPTGHSAQRLRVPTLAERLRQTSPRSRSVALSMKPRSTVMLAGRGGTAVTWFADSNVWGTSTAYTPTPVPEVQAFVTANPVERDRTVVWERLRPLGAYTHRDDAAHERGRTGWTRSFPHPLAGAPGSTPTRFFDLWERSPYSDMYLGRMAAELVRAFRLGQRDVVDYLAVSFSALDYVGHDFGPESHEVQDTLFRLDQTLGELLSVLDSAVGRNNYVVGLSADHGVSRIPEAVHAEGGEAGRVLNAEVRKIAEAAMTAAHGVGPHIAHVEYTNVYLTAAARARMKNDPAFVAPLIEAVSKHPGVARVFPSADLPAKRNSADPVERAAALSYHQEESGEVMVVLKENWIGTNTSAATHGSAQWYDQQVPVIVMGAPFKSGRFSAAATPADLAPTLASTINLRLPDADGKVLKEALR
jgi:predicted AlkP superfamily pyrophosphatase or phosphodiesterase